VFWTVATTALEDVGRGATVVDTTLEPIPGAGNPFAYFSQEQVKGQGSEDTQCMVAGYGPIRRLRTLNLPLLVEKIEVSFQLHHGDTEGTEVLYLSVSAASFQDISW
jgi:hypothetical protein